jgi:hypothetical protein
LVSYANNIEKTLIYQPQARDFKNPHLKEKFEILSDTGFTHIVLQWSIYGEYDFLKKHTDWFDKLFFLADQYHIKIIMGLYADPNYFSHIQKKKYDIEAYLKRLLIANKKTIDEILDKYEKKQAFFGWYIYDELNDVVWQKEKRRKALMNYLQTLNDYLVKKTPSKQVFISAYDTDTMDPKAYTSLLDNVVPKRWNILIQTAVGAGLIDIQTWDMFYRMCQTRLAHKWIPIIEIFSIKKKQIKSSYTAFDGQKKYMQQSHALFSWRYLFDQYFLVKYQKYISQQCHIK